MTDFWCSNGFGEKERTYAVLKSLCRAHSLQMPTHHVVQSVQNQHFGLSARITKNQFETTSQAAVVESLKLYSGNAPHLCSVLHEVLTNDCEDLTNIDAASAVLRDVGFTFHELAKLSTVSIRDMLCDGGLDEVDAAKVALAIYSRSRRGVPNEVILLRPLEKALEQLKAQDETVSIPCGLDDRSFAAVAEAVLANKKLQHLDLSLNNLEHAGAEKIEKLLRQLSSLVELSVRGSRFLRGGCELILRGVQAHGNIRTLDLSGCHGGPRLVKSLTVLNNLKSLECLSLAANDIRQIDSFPSFPNLLRLDLDSNMLENSCVEIIARLLESLPRLQTLSLNNNCLNDKGVLMLLTAVAKHSQLEELALSHNPITDAGAHAVVEALQNDSVALTNAHLDGCLLSESAFATFTASKNRNQVKKQQALSRLQTIPMSEWSMNEAATVLKHCVHDTHSFVQLVGKAGADLAVLCNLSISHSSWRKLQKFQL